MSQFFVFFFCFLCFFVVVLFLSFFLWLFFFAPMAETSRVPACTPSSTRSIRNARDPTHPPPSTRSEMRVVRRTSYHRATSGDLGSSGRCNVEAAFDRQGDVENVHGLIRLARWRMMAWRGRNHSNASVHLVPSRKAVTELSISERCSKRQTKKMQDLHESSCKGSEEETPQTISQVLRRLQFRPLSFNLWCDHSA